MTERPHIGKLPVAKVWLFAARDHITAKLHSHTAENVKLVSAAAD